MTYILTIFGVDSGGNIMPPLLNLELKYMKWSK